MVQPLKWLSTLRRLRAAEVISTCTIMLRLWVSCRFTSSRTAFLWNPKEPNFPILRSGSLKSYKTRPFVPILSQMNPIHFFTPHLFHMSFNNHLPPTPMYSSIFISQDLRPNLLYVFLTFDLDGPGIEFRLVEIFRAGVLIETWWRLCMMIWKYA